MNKQTKICTKCGIEQSLAEFHKSKSSKDGLRYDCKSCRKEENENNRIRSNIYHHKHKTTIKEKRKIDYLNKKEKYSERSRKYYVKNKEHIKKCNKLYYEKHKTVIQNRVNKYVKERCKIDPNFKLTLLIRSRINSAIKNNSKYTSSLKLLGCTIEELRTYLESQFQEGMTWDNHSVHGWHIDHIRPCASFDLTDPEQQKKCFNFKNLQPLWAEDNLSKGGKY